jgi:hypothetical protein
MRYVYADELAMDSLAFREMRNQVSAWAILWVINGWTEGSGYHHPHGSVIADKGERVDGIGNCLMVNEDFPAMF